MDEMIESTVNAEPVGNVEPQEEIAEQLKQVEPTESVTEEVAEPQQEQQKTVQDAQTNAMFAKIRREAEQKAKDNMISEMYGQTHGIHTYAEYQRAVQEQKRQQEAEQKGIDPQFYNQFMEMQEKLNSIEKEKTFIEQEAQLTSDPEVGHLYTQWKDDVKSVSKEFNVDLNTAFTLILRQNLGSILGQTSQKAQQETIQKINNNATSSPGGLSSEATHTKESVSKMSTKDFKELQNRVLRGEIKEF
ncbi:MAG: hypothetical protein K0S61_686 [Anaerocolumna sp.]|jgi:hypothetical protein|nr:hypothetical protein [Anaerocolumna sp.]